MWYVLLNIKDRSKEGGSTPAGTHYPLPNLKWPIIRICENTKETATSDSSLDPKRLKSRISAQTISISGIQPDIRINSNCNIIQRFVLIIHTFRCFVQKHFSWSPISPSLSLLSSIFEDKICSPWDPTVWGTANLYLT